VVVVAQTLAHARAKERLAQEREQLAQEALLANDALAAAGLLAARAGLRGDRGGAAAIDAWLAQAQPILGRAAVHRARAQGGAPASQAFVADALPQLDAAVVAAVRWRADLEWLAALESELAAPWARVRAEVRADPRYAGLDLPPQFGLRPLGRDPGSGLFEFQLVDPSRRALPPAAREIARGPDGALVMAADMDPVLVLLPGGAFTMGTLAGPVAENAGLDESLNIVALERPAQTGTRVAAFFVGKFEVTAAQHAAVTGESPAFWGVAMFREAQEAVRQRQEQGMESGAEGHNRALERAATHGMPVDSVTWEEASAMAARLGARLPVEAEWEYAARGGTSSAWSCAPTEAEIRRHANLADCKDKDIVLRVTDEPMLDFTASDGVGPPAPVGCFAANPFGLYDVHGNVQEWCAEPLRPYGEAAVGDPKSRVVRGGSHQSAIQVSRSAARQEARAGAAAQDLGFRLARDVVTAAAR
jgi:formylglycine-generating enzyme required for sulfatase activity